MLFSPFGFILTLMARLLGTVVPQYRPPVQRPQTLRTVADVNAHPDGDQATSAAVRPLR